MGKLVAEDEEHGEDEVNDGDCPGKSEGKDMHDAFEDV